MRLAHLADLHLGFKAFHALDARGRNLREVQVSAHALTVAHAVAATGPDLIVVAGDVFHLPAVSPAVFREALGIFRALTAAAPVVVAAGNHDTPRTRSVGHLLLTLADAVPGVHVAVSEPATYHAAGATVLAVPESVSPCDLPSTTGDRPRVLVLHGDVQGASPRVSAATWPREAVTASWNVACFGHWHLPTEIGPRAWYAGAPDSTSSDPWQEAREIEGRALERGWRLWDVDAGTSVHMPVPGAVRYHDLNAGDAEDAAPADLTARMASLVADVPAGDVARVVLRNVGRDTAAALDLRAVRRAGRHLLHCQPVIRRAESVEVGSRRVRSTRSLAELLADRIAQNVADPAERETICALGARYIQDAEPAEVAA
jgi:DNA repair exonuclease SbcCD nuclease subunit